MGKSTSGGSIYEIIFYIGFHTKLKEEDKPIYQKEDTITLRLDIKQAGYLLRAVKEIIYYLSTGHKEYDKN